MPIGSADLRVMVRNHVVSLALCGPLALAGLLALHDAFWGSRFGMLADRYGTNWMFNCELKKA